MIEDDFAVGQIMRLGGLHFFPSQSEAQDELVNALKEVAIDETHAVEVITDWLRNKTDAPTPAHIYAMKPAPQPKTKTREELY